MRISAFLIVMSIAGSAHAQLFQTCATYMGESDKSIEALVKRAYRKSIQEEFGVTPAEAQKASACFARVVSEVRQSVSEDCRKGSIDAEADIRLAALRAELLQAMQRCVSFSVAVPGPVIPAEPAP